MAGLSVWCPPSPWIHHTFAAIHSSILCHTIPQYCVIVWCTDSISLWHLTLVPSTNTGRKMHFPLMPELGGVRAPESWGGFGQSCTRGYWKRFILGGSSGGDMWGQGGIRQGSFKFSIGHTATGQPLGSHWVATGQHISFKGTIQKLIFKQNDQ